MLNQGTIFAVIISSFFTLQHAANIRNRDIEEILDLLNGQKPLEAYSTSDESSSDNTRSIHGRLKTIDVIDLINNAKHDRNSPLHQHKLGKGSQKYGNDYRDGNSKINYEQLFKGHDAVYLTHNGHQRVQPNKLLGPDSLEEDNKQPDFNDYSKIYVIIDPAALQESKNKKALSGLLSKILSISSSSNENTSHHKRHVHGGLNVKHDLLARRYRRDSMEGKDSMEEDYKPRRPRSGGSAGAGGRTAIPYIKQRGDIYERDH